MKEQNPLADRSITEIIQNLANETSLLVRQEIELVRAEVLSALKGAMRPAVAFGVAALFGVGTFGAVTALLIVAIAVALPLWAAAAIVSVLYGAIAAASIAFGRSAMRDVSAIPHQTIRTIKDDVRTVRSGIARGR